MFGPLVRFSITYKTNQAGFTNYTRKYYHNFKVAITNKNYEGAKGASLKTMGSYLMTDGMHIGIYNEKTFKITDSWEVKTRDGDPENQILYLTVSPKENKVGVCIGKILIQDVQIISEIIVYKYNHDNKIFE
jgi:hypothetical protein